MNILVITPSLARGGSERVVSLLTQEWVKTHSVRVALFNANGQVFPVGGDLIDLNLPPRSSRLAKILQFFLRIYRLYKLFKSQRPDRIFSFMESANLPSIVAANIIGISDRLVVSVHNNPKFFPSFYRMLMPTFYRHARTTVAVSAGIRDQLQMMGISLHCLKVIPNPVDSSMWKMSSLNYGQVEPNWIRSEPFFLAVGRLEPQKGFDLLIDAIKLLDVQKARLVILGEGNERVRLQELIRQEGLGERVLLPGAMANPVLAYQKALFYVMSSRHEGWPMVLTEAMAAGCPVVSFACDYGPGEIIEHGVSGLLVPTGDVAGLADAIRLLLEDRNMREKLRAGGLARVEQFRVDRVAPRWLKGKS